MILPVLEDSWVILEGFFVLSEPFDEGVGRPSLPGKLLLEELEELEELEVEPWLFFELAEGVLLLEPLSHKKVAGSAGGNPLSYPTYRVYVILSWGHVKTKLLTFGWSSFFVFVVRGGNCVSSACGCRKICVGAFKNNCRASHPSTPTGSLGKACAKFTNDIFRKMT